MKLRIMFSQLLPFYNTEDNRKKSEKCVEIAEDFAIGFAEWNHKEGRFIQQDLTTKQLLEIYKKEKGL